MSETEALQNELRVSQELLFLLVSEFGPVTLNIAESREKSMTDKMIDLDLDSDAGTMTLSIVEVPNGES